VLRRKSPKRLAFSNFDRRIFANLIGIDMSGWRRLIKGYFAALRLRSWLRRDMPSASGPWQSLDRKPGAIGA
jgi:hypothetical protein